MPSASQLPPPVAQRAPGLYVEQRRAERTPAAPTVASGVPVFVGFATLRADQQHLRDRHLLGVECTRFDQFARAFEPAGGGHLRSAVRGFFANGGRRCVVLALASGASAHGHGATQTNAAALLRALEPGGPLRDRSDVDLLCVPDAVSALVGGEQARHAVQAAMLDHCAAAGDRFAILDAPAVDAGAGFDQLLRAPSSLRSEFGAMYFPWVAPDPSLAVGTAPVAPTPTGQWRCLVPEPDESHGPETGFVPPSGHIAGLYARMDREVGVHRAPANEILHDALDTPHALSPAQRGLLNDARINCIVRTPGHGLRVGGARTLSGHERWAHVSTARVVIAFRRWLVQGMADLVFESQTPALWERIRIRLSAHCLELFASGALAGADASQAFSVKCDAETNPLAVREQGQVVAEVGLAPTIPAEFIVVRVVHDASGFAISEL